MGAESALLDAFTSFVVGVVKYLESLTLLLARAEDGAVRGSISCSTESGMSRPAPSDIMLCRLLSSRFF